MLGEIIEEIIGGLLEGIFDNIFDSSSERIKKRKLPGPVRIIFKVLGKLVYLAFIVFLGLLAAVFFSEGDIGFGIFAIILIAVFIAIPCLKLIKGKR